MDCADKHVFPEALYRQVAEDGFVGTMVPEQYGGAGQGMVEMHLFLEGLSNNGIPLLNLVVGAAMSLGFIAKYGSGAAKEPLSARGLQRQDAILFCHHRTRRRHQHHPHLDHGEKARQPLRVKRPEDLHHRRRWRRLCAGRGADDRAYRGPEKDRRLHAVHRRSEGQGRAETVYPGQHSGAGDAVAIILRRRRSRAGGRCRRSRQGLRHSVQEPQSGTYSGGLDLLRSRPLRAEPRRRLRATSARSSTTCRSAPIRACSIRSPARAPISRWLR